MNGTRFTSIKNTNDGISLAWVTNSGHGDEETFFGPCADAPTPDFLAAFAALKPYAVRVLDLQGDWADEVEVYGLSMGETKGRRWIIAHCRRKVDSAVLLIKTPREEREAEDNPGAAGRYPATMDELIDALEACALRYRNGEREQVEIEFEGGGSLAEVESDEEGEDGEEKPDSDIARHRAAKKRAPGRAKKARDAEAERRSIEELRTALLQAGRDVPIEIIGQRTTDERDEAARWCVAVDKRKKNVIAENAVPKIPKWVAKHGTASLLEQQVGETAGAS